MGVQRSVLVDVDLQEAEMMRLSLLLTTVFLISLALSETHNCQEDKQEITQDAVQLKEILKTRTEREAGDRKKKSLKEKRKKKNNKNKKKGLKKKDNSKKKPKKKS